ncbi:MAG TPA: GNAT family N-acetyltransferase [Gemmatimonadaceae bacterium]|nr:GNAT family N-acetyltransferase [Gemmatimonadaceae bacterium]
MRIAFPSDDNQFLAPTQQRSYTRVTNSAPIIVRAVTGLEMVGILPDLVELFTETVNNGSPLGFLAPITHTTARSYWVSLIPELEAGSRLLLVAFDGDTIVGSGQLALSQRHNSPHRAELQKLFVGLASRGRGVGRTLMDALHAAARQHGRTLILLSTRHQEQAEKFYKSLGYVAVGVVPGWTIDRAGNRYDHVEMYRDFTAIPDDQG